MMKQRMMVAAAVVGMSLLGPVAGVAQTTADSSAAAAAAPASAGETMPLEQLLPMTVHEAWVASGRNEDRFFAMVSQLATLSAQKRGVTLPDDQAAGSRAGKTFKRIARKDPGQLLYVAVDNMVRHAAEKKAGTATP